MNNIKKAQDRMLTILIEIDRICKLNNINYWLDAGTLLGAKRHFGFIPWDDDIDVCMLREDYNKFIDCCNSELNSEFFLQTADTDRHYPKRTIPCKIRLNNTKIIESDDVLYGVENFNFHKGLFVDVFPMDYYAENKNIIRVQRLFSVLYYIKTSSLFKKHKSYLRYVLAIISKILPWKTIESWKKNIIKSQNIKHSKNIGYGIEIPNCNYFNNYDVIFPLKEIQFCNFYFSCPNNTEKYLETLYGKNYMQLPEESKRVNHSVSIELYEK
ncbi:LicD family protein [Photobacterium leiognathi]|uniref:LicD family protein n=1 Tax=Photobacterium leiognathi TaxID=553611 RepID=UPI002981DB13|nr:LicD family protein [Photobacterium leiognathi]